MPSNAAITINDGAANIVLSPISVQNGVAKYSNLAASPEIKRQELALKITSKAALRTVTGVFVFPRVVDELINGVTVSRVVDFATYKGEWIVPRTWTEADIAKFRIASSDISTETLPGGMVDRGEFVW